MKTTILVLAALAFSCPSQTKVQPGTKVTAGAKMGVVQTGLCTLTCQWDGDVLNYWLDGRDCSVPLAALESCGRAAR